MSRKAAVTFRTVAAPDPVAPEAVDPVKVVSAPMDRAAADLAVGVPVAVDLVPAWVTLPWDARACLRLPRCPTA